MRTFFLLFLLFFFQAYSFGQQISLEACNSKSNIAARNICLKSYVENLLLIEFEKRKNSITLENESENIILEVLVDQAGGFNIMRLEVDNIGLYMAVKEVIKNLRPISSYKNKNGVILYDSFTIAMNYPDVVKKNRQGSTSVKKHISFQNVQKSPVFPGCYATANSEFKKCLSKNVEEHIMNNFNLFVGMIHGIPSGNQRINIQFEINEYGYISNIKAKANYKKLEEEAIRVIKALPRMTPAKQDNEPVAVVFYLPMIFKLR
ncbi:energy transducer TonB [Marixanthomonas spongiae]|uniref:TonB C-terminal domain-containing protein n=1 Tax=Marixanthomonas spongiae TaxID=2174845 RepID=A0A2U0I7S8_9FLAO|nr:energy transducer TonB [Marixanthomonas spongiae]PVW17161.1 hypothetical protein DDV96_01190 [Marixanthomonas spongiae]